MIYPFPRHRFFLSFLGIALLTLLFWGAKVTAYQILIINKHNDGQNRLLNYVIELRNELKDYRILPYALTDNPSLLTYMQAPNHDPALSKQLQRQLEDLTHVSKTLDWFILSKQGQLLLSSKQSPNFKLYDYFTKNELQTALQEQQGESILISGYNPALAQAAHLVLAPVYTSNGLAGAVAVRINVNNLVEKWSLAGDLVVMTDHNQLVFQANNLTHFFGAKWQQKQSNIQLLNHTQAKIFRHGNKQYLLQNVTLDDLNWQIHYLSSLESIQTTAQTIAIICLGVGALIFFFWLYLRERALKIASKLENEQLIAKSTQLQRALIEKTHIGLLQLTQQGQISFVNPMGIRYFGQHAQINARFLHELLPDCPENQYAINFIHALQSNINLLQENPFLEQEVMIKKDNNQTFPALLSISSLEWSDSHGYLATLLDISKRKKAELSLLEANSRLEERVLERTKELEVAQQELLRTEKLAAIGQMSTAIAHELNQPLTGIRTLAYSAELLIKRQQSEQALKTMMELQTLVVRMQKLTSELKVLAYRRPEKLTPTRVKQCVMQAIESLGEDTKNTQWNIALHDDDKVMAEPTRLERIFSNLINNSIQACAELDPIIKISLQQQGELTAIYYQDNGPGLAADDIEHIFEPFFTTKPIGKGLGLGLAISANLAKDMNGTLSAEHNSASQLIFRLMLSKA